MVCDSHCSIVSGGLIVFDLLPSALKTCHYRLHHTRMTHTHTHTHFPSDHINIEKYDSHFSIQCTFICIAPSQYSSCQEWVTAILERGPICRMNKGVMFIGKLDTQWMVRSEDNPISRTGHMTGVRRDN